MKQDKLIQAILMAIALSAIGGLALIALFIFKEGLPVILQIGAVEFFSSTDWSPGERRFGILSMIVGSVAVTLGNLVIGVVFSLGLAIVLTEFCPPKVARVLKPLIELLAGIPSVVYGFIGMVTIVPLIRDTIGGPGFSVLAASIVLGIMVLPTVTTISIDALNAVPRSFWEGSVIQGPPAGGRHMLMLKAARSGILAAIILGMGRAIGRPMAVIMVTGNSLEIPRSLTDPVRTLTSNIALEMNYAASQHRKASLPRASPCSSSSWRPTRWP